MQALWTIAANPRRRKSRKHRVKHNARRKGRSAAQRAATARMLAANRASRGGTVSHKRRGRKRSAVARHTRARSISRRRSSGFSMRGIGGGAMGLVKAGAIGAGGALLVDLGMGFVNGILPASMNTKTNLDGSINYMNYIAKGALAVGLGAFGGKVFSRETAHRMAAGSMTVMAYEIMRPLAQSVLPASMSLGWYSPGMTFRAGVVPGMNVGRMGKMGNYQTLPRMGNYQSTRAPIRSPNAVPGNVRAFR